MKHIERYLKEVVKIKPLGELTTQEDVVGDLSGEMVYIDGKCSDIFISHADYVNWLENKYEQKSVDNLEPKFKVGDWIVHNRTRTMLKVVDTKPMIVTVVSTLGYHHTISTDTIEENYHLWSIEDAKDGDVLCDYHEAYDNPLIFILKNFVHVNFGLVTPSDYSSYCFLTAGDRQRFKEGTYHHKHNIKPATTEQRDLLFQKMREAGYKWDAERKELEKIELAKSESEKELSDFEAALFSAFSDGWQQYLHGEEVDVAQWAKEHSAELLEAAKHNK